MGITAKETCKKVSNQGVSDENPLMLKLGIWNRRKIVSKKSSFTWVLRALDIYSGWLRNYVILRVSSFSRAIMSIRF